MPFDGRYYLGAQPIAPALYHARAPAAADLCAGALRAGYLYALHQATLIGSQTYRLRMRRGSPMASVSSTSAQRVAEWCAVHLAAHHTQVIAELYVALTRNGGDPVISARVVATDGTTTVTGTTQTLTVPSPEEAMQVNGHPVHHIIAAVDVSTLTRPTEAALVYLEAWATVGGVACAMAPMVATAWRTSL